ncbi:MBL fold metallo-hydrolase [candidate division KSB1 bacterium]
MKRTILTAFVALYNIILIPLSFACQTEDSNIEFKKISDKLYLVMGGEGANGGIYIGDDGVLLVESKSVKKDVDYVFDRIRELTDKPVKYVINTHYDLDHTWGNQFLPESVLVIGHENLKKDLFHPKSRYKEYLDNKEFIQSLPSITFRDKMDIQLGKSNIELWYFGIGHSTGDIVVFLPEEKFAFVGDQVFLGMTPGVYSEIGGSIFKHLNTLRKMLDTIDADRFINGHYNSILSRTDIWNYIFELRKKQEKVRELLNKGKNLDEVKKEFDEIYRYIIESMYNELKNKINK